MKLPRRKCRRCGSKDPRECNQLRCGGEHLDPGHPHLPGDCCAGRFHGKAWKR